MPSSLTLAPTPRIRPSPLTLCLSLAAFLCALYVLSVPVLPKQVPILKQQDASTATMHIQNPFSSSKSSPGAHAVPRPNGKVNIGQAARSVDAQAPRTATTQADHVRQDRLLHELEHLRKEFQTTRYPSRASDS